MSRKIVMSSLMATALIATALSVVGCKKEEKAQEPAPAPAAQQSAQPAPQQPAQAGAASYDFDSDINGWTGTDGGVKTEQTVKEKHGGKGSMKVTGTAGATQWGFANSPKVTLEPGKKYKLVGWMKVESWDKKDFPPLLKFSLHKDGKWASNAFTSKYDLGKKNQWQEVGTIFEAPQGAIDGSISLEKGTQDPITATVYLDDVKVQPVQ